MANKILIDGWTFKRSLPKPFDVYTDKPSFTDVYSKYCTQPRKRSTLHAATLRAVLAYMELESPTGASPAWNLGAIGSQGNDFTIAEYPSKTGELHVVVYNRIKRQFLAGRYTTPPDVEITPEKYVFKENENSGAALLFALLPTALMDEECNAYYQKLKEHRDNGYPDIEKAANDAAVFCDNIYRRVRYADNLSCTSLKTSIAANGSIPLLKPFAIEKGTYAPTTVIAGDFQVITTDKNSVNQSNNFILHSNFVNKYILSTSRTLTPTEELTVPSLPEWYVIPQEIKMICEHAKLTTNTIQPMRNFLLRGPAGTGKTEGAKAIASALHLPYRCITCSANTEIFDLLGQIIPDTDSDKPILLKDYPSFQDILLDPATAYQKLTGIYDENVSEDFVYQTLVETLSNESKNSNGQPSDKQKFKYVDTPLVEAIRHGYLIEIQEPTVIANPGVLVGLNSLLDRCNSVFLPNGEVITRHPDTVIVVTTNNDYVGCKQMNQSVISRMNLVIDLKEPSEETLVERVLGITGCNDKPAVQQMAKLVKSISEYCKENMITDGCCGVRELISWVQSYMICNDIMDAARYTVLSSISADSESQQEVENSCLESKLAS